MDANACGATTQHGGVIVSHYLLDVLLSARLGRYLRKERLRGSEHL
jgi:hypothetical protein